MCILERQTQAQKGDFYPKIASWPHSWCWYCHYSPAWPGPWSRPSCYEAMYGPQCSQGHAHQHLSKSGPTGATDGRMRGANRNGGMWWAGDFSLPLAYVRTSNSHSVTLSISGDSHEAGNRGKSEPRGHAGDREALGHFWPQPPGTSCFPEAVLGVMGCADSSGSSRAALSLLGARGVPRVTHMTTHSGFC